MSDFDFTDNSGMFLSAMDIAKAKALEIMGIKAEKYAKAAAPVGTPESTGIPGYRGGTLRNSISHKTVGDSAYIGTNVEYAPYQELGTIHMVAANKGRGYLRPAVEDHINEYKNIIENEMKNA